MSTNAPTIVTDSKGRALTIRPLTALEEFDLLEAAGANSDNRRWMMTGTICATVRDVDGVPCPFPRDRAGIRNQVEHVGAEGLAAIIGALNVPDPDDGLTDGERAEQATRDMANTAKN